MFCGFVVDVMVQMFLRFKSFQFKKKFEAHDMSINEPLNSFFIEESKQLFLSLQPWLRKWSCIPKALNPLKTWLVRWCRCTDCAVNSFLNKIIMTLVWELSNLCLLWPERWRGEILIWMKISCWSELLGTATCPNFSSRTPSSSE